MKKLVIVVFANLIYLLFISYINNFIVELNFLKKEFTGFFEDQIQQFIFSSRLYEKYSFDKVSYDIDTIKLSLRVDFANRIVECEEIITISLLDSSKEFLVFDCGNNLRIKNLTDSYGKETFYFQKRNNLFVRSRESSSYRKYSITYQFDFDNRFYKGFITDPESQHFYTLSEPNFSKYWYICKENPSDKFFAQVSIILPENLTAVSNGILVDSNRPEIGFRKFTYKSDYPVNHYLLFVAGGKYEIIRDLFVDGESNDTLRLEHFVFEESLNRAKEDLQLIKTIYERLKPFTGEYPFKNEIYGVVEISWPYGGMEHQTRSAITTNAFKGLYSAYGLNAHEFAHQWFGNFVTCEKWEDIWLNEGFSTYFENLSYVTSNSDIEIELPVHDFYESVHRKRGNIFSKTVYDKGAWILKMLRNEVGEETFYHIISDYLNKFRFSSASSEDFMNVCYEISKRDLGWFFDQWLYSRISMPYYVVEYTTEKNDSNNYFCRVIIKQIQPETIFKNNLDIEISFSDGTRKSFVLKNYTQEQIFSFNSSSKITNVIIDKDNRILKQVNYKQLKRRY